MNIYLANPRGFCAGVDRAIDIVERALQIFGAPVYVRHEVVHNRFVVDDLANKGAVFVEELDEIPDGATVIFSAHGVSQQVRQQAEHRQLKVFDATCPLVTKVHLEVARHAQSAEEVILIGHAGHPEVEGTLGQYDNLPGGNIYLVETIADIDHLEVNNPQSLAYVTQTTLSVDDTKMIIDRLREKFPDIKGPRKDDICYATQNRQDAVRELAQHVDVFLVLGSTNSSNSNRLRELAEKQGVPAYLIDGADNIEAEWLKSANAVGVTAGASAPEILVQQVIDKLEKQYGARVIQNGGQTENVSFQLPKELR
ncbi:MAG: 4-hydroxy-3-methylbut-2-enyl diphosphate reductase [Gammaproteobacteria bacterium]|jgi:4-hydroxy-3-methylbut-2-enyl diphosphate reductase